MHVSREQKLIRILSGEDRSLRANILRSTLSIAEPFYSTAMRARNALYDAGIFASHKLPRPTISVGNITTGGTGKTPIVQWLAQQLIRQRLRPAILTRGYRAKRAAGSDEAQLLAAALADRAHVIVNPNRVAAAMLAMRELRQPDVFILDDGFQHRRAARDFNLVLISATNPFGYNHVLPRGLLREPVTSLRRADAILITRADQAPPPELPVHNIPTYHAYHHLAGLRDADDQLLPLDELTKKRFALFCGIADPKSLQQQLGTFGDNFAASYIYPDHHAHTAADLAAIDRSKIDVLVTTEKDWVKLDAQARAMLPIWRLNLEIHFRENDEEKLLARILQKLTAPASSPAAAR
jgi:tetraacyldisaccharide 4'-kinase